MKYLVLLLVCLQSIIASANSVEINGVNLAEKRIRWMWQHIGTVVSACNFDSVHCGDPKYLPTIKALWEIVPTSTDHDMQAWQNQLVFKRESEFAFESDQGETHRIAMTGSQPGSVIYLNLDRIESLPSVPYDYDFYLGILVHELTHHLGIKDDQERLPDQIGAYVSKYFKSKFLASSQSIIPGQNVSMNVFNYDAPMNWSKGSFEMGDSLYDLQMSESGATNPCDGPYAFVTQQRVDLPRWRVSQLSIKRKSITLEATALGDNTCTSMFGPSKDPYHKTILWKAEVQFKYDQAMNEANWDLLVPVLNKKESNLAAADHADLIRLAQSAMYTLRSTVPPAKTADPGSILKYEFEFVDTLNTVFDGCEAQITSEDWGWFSPGGLPKMINVDSCTISSIDATRRKVVLVYQVPSSVVTVPLQLYSVILYSKDKFFVAYPAKPALSLINGNVAYGLSPMKVTFKDLQPLAQLGPQPLDNSFLTGSSDQFEVQMEIATDSQLLRTDFELSVLVSDRGELASSPYSGPVGADKILIKNTKKNVESKKLTITLNYEIPKMLNVLGCYGVKFDALSVLTSQLEQVTVSYPGRYELLILSPRILQ